MTPILIGACAETFGEAASVTAATRAARTASGRLIGRLPRSEIWRREHSARGVGGGAGIGACVAARGALLARPCGVLDRLRGALCCAGCWAGPGGRGGRGRRAQAGVPGGPRAR